MFRATRRIALVQVFLIAPAALFMGALLFRSLGPPQWLGAQQIVQWFAARIWTLWYLLGLMPMIAFAVGVAALAESRKRDANFRMTMRQLLGFVGSQFPYVLIAATTLGSAAILGIVALHVAAN